METSALTARHLLASPAPSAAKAWRVLIGAAAAWAVGFCNADAADFMALGVVPVAAQLRSADLTRALREGASSSKLKFSAMVFSKLGLSGSACVCVVLLFERMLIFLEIFGCIVTQGLA